MNRIFVNKFISSPLYRGLHSSNQQLYPTSATTLGRFSKSTNRLTSSATPVTAPSLLSPHHRTHHDYRSTQTLPRKLDNHKKSGHSTSAINVSVASSQQHRRDSAPVHIPSHNTGPAKPARTYKALNRSKSFNVHGLNGTNDPSPIYIEKLTHQHRHSPGTAAALAASSMYKSNPHLNEEKPQLKSPSIVNLISRSQRDLSKIDEDSDHQQQQHRVFHYNHINKASHMPSPTSNGHHPVGGAEKRSTFMRGLQDQAPDLYRNIHGDEDVRRPLGATKYTPGRVDHESSLGSRSPVTHLNKDIASIVRRGSTSTDDYSETYKITSKSDDPRRPSITNTVHSFTKKTLPSRNGGRGKETIESNERKTVTTSRYNSSDALPSRYQSRNSIHAEGGIAPGPVVIELRNRM